MTACLDGSPHSPRTIRDTLLTWLSAALLAALVAAFTPVGRIQLAQSRLHGLIAGYGYGINADSFPHSYLVNMPDGRNPGAFYLMAWAPVDENGAQLTNASPGYPLQTFDQSVNFVGPLTGGCSLSGTYGVIGADLAAGWLVDPRFLSYAPSGQLGPNSWLYGSAPAPQYARSIASFDGETRTSGTVYGGNWPNMYTQNGHNLPMGGGVHADVSGDLKARFAWTYTGYRNPNGSISDFGPSGSTDLPLPPKGLQLLFDTRVEADALYVDHLTNVGDSHAIAWANNNFGDAVQVSILPQDAANGIYWQSASIAKKRIRMVPVINGVATADLSGSTARIVNNSLPGDVNSLTVQAAAASYGTVRVDPHKVKIQCEALEPPTGNYQKLNGQRVLNERNYDDSLKVDTVVTWVPETVVVATPPTDAMPNPTYAVLPRHWVFGSTLQAKTEGFDLVVQYRPSQQNVYLYTRFDWSGDVVPSGAFDMPDYVGVSQGGSREQDLPKTLRAHVDATQLWPAESLVASNDYTIVLHNPLENVNEVGRVFAGAAPFPWSEWVDLGLTDKVPVLLKGARDWTIFGQNSQQMFGVLLSGVCGSGLVALAPGTGGSDVILADMLFNAIGWAVSSSGTPEPDTTDKVTVDLDCFIKSVNEQVNLASQLWPEDYRINSKWLFEIADKGAALFWKNHRLYARGHNGRNHTRVSFQSDAYDAAGYVGQKNNDLVYPTTLAGTVIQWAVDDEPRPEN